ncbi:MAG: PAS domain S-box protein [Candidatus Omnitrophota bacterium]
MSLRYKLILWLVGVVVVAVAIVASIAVESSQKSLKKSIGEDLQHIAESAAEAIDDYINGRIVDMKILSQSNVFKGNDIRSMHSYLDKIREINPNFDELNLINSRGKIIASTNTAFVGKHFLSKDRSSFGFFERASTAAQGSIFLKESITRGERPEFRISIFTPVLNEKRSRTEGVLCGVINMGRVERITHRLSEQTVGDKASCLLNDLGEVLVGGNDNGGGHLKQLSDFRVIPYLEYILGGDKKGYTTYIDSAGDAVLAGYAGLGGYGLNHSGIWTLITIVPQKEVFLPVEKLRNRIIMVAVAGVFIAGILAFFVARGITNPVLELARVTDLIAKGDLSQKADIASNDEIGVLAKSFNKMTAKLNISIESRDNEISERKKVEEKLRIFKTISDRANYGTAMFDLKGDILYVNDTFAAMHGYTIRELVGRRISVLHTEDQMEKVRSLADRMRKGEDFSDEEVWRKKRDGKIFPTRMNGTVIKDASDKPVFFSTTAIDITESKKAEMESARLEKQLRDAQKMRTIGTMAGGIAHDFNNILAIIFGYTDILKRDALPGSRMEANLKELNIAANDAKNLVKHLLTFSRETKLEYKAVKLDVIIDESLNMLKPSIADNIRIKKNIDPRCGLVLADPTQMRQVLTNLITNSLHAMIEKGGVLEISLGMVEMSENLVKTHPGLKEGTYVRLIVGDTGHGMDQATKERIFEPFFTTKRAKTGPRGSGLGLSVVHGIVGGHGGEIKVYTEPGKGASFHVYLPRYNKEIQGDAESPIEAEIPGGSERVLFVDDEEKITIMAKEMLEGLGYSVFTYTSGADALDAFTKDPAAFDIIITDQTMPRMTGTQFAVEIRKIRPEIPIILTTGFSETVSAENFREYGIQDYLMKPLVTEDFTIAIRRLIDAADA